MDVVLARLCNLVRILNISAGLSTNIFLLNTKILILCFLIIDMLTIVIVALSVFDAFKFQNIGNIC